MYLKFGTGEVCITTVVYQDKENILLIEPGKGTGKIGGCPEDRKKGTELDLNDLNSDINVIMKFENSSSVQVLIDGLEVIKKEIKKDEEF